jgi:hypothetical protein
VHAFGHWHDADIGHADGLPMLQLTGRMVVIQQSKIQALDSNEIDAISGAYCEGIYKWLGLCPPYRIDGGDPIEPTGPVTDLQP